MELESGDKFFFTPSAKIWGVILSLFKCQCYIFELFYDMHLYICTFWCPEQLHSFFRLFLLSFLLKSNIGASFAWNIHGLVKFSTIWSRRISWKHNTHTSWTIIYYNKVNIRNIFLTHAKQCFHFYVSGYQEVCVSLPFVVINPIGRYQGISELKASLQGVHFFVIFSFIEKNHNNHQ